MDNKPFTVLLSRDQYKTITTAMSAFDWDEKEIASAMTLWPWAELEYAFHMGRISMEDIIRLKLNKHVDGWCICPDCGHVCEICNMMMRMEPANEGDMICQACSYAEWDLAHRAGDC